MVIFLRNAPLPRCCHCGIRMDHYIFGVPENKQSHPECAGRAMADAAIAELRKYLGIDEIQNNAASQPGA